MNTSALPPSKDPEDARAQPVPETPQGAGGVQAAGPADSALVWMHRVQRWGGWALAALALLLIVLLWQRLSLMQGQLVRQNTDSGQAAMEAKAAAKQAQEQVQELTARLTLTEAKLGEVALQRGQLDDLIQSLSRSRDENLVVDIESALRLAQQQAQLTGSLEPLLAALKSAETRVARASQPRLAPLQRALLHDWQRLKAIKTLDTPSLLIRIDELIAWVDDVPLANQVGLPVNTPRRPQATMATTTTPTEQELDWRALPGRLWSDIKSWVRVARVDQPEAALLAPEQSYFLRENTKLVLLNVRLAVLSRQYASAQKDLQHVGQWLHKYFLVSSPKTQNMVQSITQLQQDLRQTEQPRIDGSMAALATAAAGR